MMELLRRKSMLLVESISLQFTHDRFFYSHKESFVLFRQIFVTFVSLW